MKLLLLLLNWATIFIFQPPASAQIITTIAGTIGSPGYSGDGGPALNAMFNHPYGLAVDNSGNIYVFDQLNAVIRKINSAGIISSFAGNGTVGYSGDGGPAIAANIDVSGIAVDNSGNIYFTDVNTDRIRKINTGGIISTIAGIGTEGYSGDGGPAILAALKEPYDVHADAFGNIFIADYNHTIRKINTAGIISTVAGTGIAGYSGDGGPATSAQLDYPLSVWVDNCGNIYITDFWNQHTIRKITYCTVPVTTGPPAVYKKLFKPNGFTPNNDGKNDIFRIPPGTTLNLSSLSVYDRAGQIVFTTNNINQGWDGKYKGVLLPTGIYVYQLEGDNPSGKIVEKGTVLLVR